jgi:hypothetical protein
MGEFKPPFKGRPKGKNTNETNKFVKSVIMTKTVILATSRIDNF